MDRTGACLAAALALAVSGCAAPTGDFGRPKPTIFNDTVLPMVGREAARARSEPVSYFMLTEDEAELRARSYRLVMPLHRKAFFARGEAELIRTRLWPDEMYRVDPTLYYRMEVAEGYSSSTGRYNALLSEIRADSELLDPFYRVVQRACRADAARLAALGDMPALARSEHADALGRVYENQRVIEWALVALAWRIESYSYALQRSRIEIPSERDYSVAAALRTFADQVAELEADIAAFDCRGGYRGEPGEVLPAVVKS